MKLQDFLESSGMTQMELADRLNISQSAVSMWLSGNRNPSPRIMKKIEEVTKGKVKMQDLFNPNVLPQNECPYRKKDE